MKLDYFKDALTHVRGESVYIDDIPIKHGTLHGVIFNSPVAKGIIKSVNYEKARQVKGVVAILTAADIPGENQIGGIVADEPLLVQHEVNYQGEPIAVLLAEKETIAEAAVKLIEIDIDELHPIVDPRVAATKKEFITPPRVYKLGDVERSFGECDYVITGQAELAGQEHLYLETQAAYAYVVEHDRICVHSSTQAPTQVQRVVSGILGIPMHQIEVDVLRA